MNVWLIGGGVYTILLFFALALCRAAAWQDTDPGIRPALANPTNLDYEELMDLDGVRIDVAADIPANDDIPSRGSRPGAGTRRSREPRMVPARQRQFIQR
jgi:hypothetical protein